MWKVVQSTVKHLICLKYKKKFFSSCQYSFYACLANIFL